MVISKLWNDIDPQQMRVENNSICWKNIAGVYTLHMPGINAEHSSRDMGVYSPMNFDFILKKKPPNNKLYCFVGSKLIINDFSPPIQCPQPPH